MATVWVKKKKKKTTTKKRKGAMKPDSDHVHLFYSRKWGRGENLQAFGQDGRGMRAVEIEATRVHQTPSSPIE